MTSSRRLRKSRQPNRQLTGWQPLESRVLLNADPGWLVTLEGSGRAYQYADVDIDAGGDVAVVGGVYGVSKYSSAGALEWNHELPGNTVSFDPSGGVVVAGEFNGVVDFDPSAGVTTLDATNGALAIYRLDAGGNLDWLQQADAVLNNYGGALDVDALGNTYVAGRYYESATFGGTTLANPSGDLTGFVARLDATGQFDWAVSQEDTWIWALQVGDQDADPANWSVYLAAEDRSVGDGVVRSLETSGQTVWDYTFTNTNSGAWDVSVGPAGDVYAIAEFFDEVDFDPTAAEKTLIADANSDVAVVKLQGDGTFVDAQHFAADTAAWSALLAAAPSGEVYVTGYFASTLEVGGVSLPSAGDTDAFLVTLDADLNVTEAVSVGGAGWDRPGPIAASEGGVVHVGDFRGKASFVNGGVAEAAFDGAWIERLNTSLGAIQGSLFLDLDQDQLPNEGAAYPVETTVYVDFNENGVRDAGEPSTQTVGRNGAFRIGNLPDGTYTVRPEWTGAWTPTTAASQTVSLLGGNTAKVDFGAWHPHETTTIEGSAFQIRSRQANYVYSYLDVNVGGGALVDVNVNVDVDFEDLSDLILWFGQTEGTGDTRTQLIDFDTTGTTLSNTQFDQDAAVAIADGFPPYEGSYRPSGYDSNGFSTLDNFDGRDIDGEWFLGAHISILDSKQRGNVNAWSMEATYLVEPQPPAAPTIDALLATPDTVVQGDAVTLEASGVEDINGDLQSVTFYRDSDRNGLLDTAVDQVLAIDSDGDDGWSASDATGSLALGEQAYFAQAVDALGATSNVATASVNIVEEIAGDANSFYIWDIRHDVRSRGKHTDLRLETEIHRDSDADGSASAGDAGAANVQVAMSLFRLSGNGTSWELVDTFSGSTDSEGIFRTDWIRNLASGTYRAEVTQLTHATLNWNPLPTDNDDDADNNGLKDQVFGFSG